MSEDCLILNIYTHWLPTTDEREDCSFSSKAKAVIFYIHGGGFVQGSSASDTGSGPQLMMDRDIVLVTINYRLGALGFLSTGTREYPGNYGMMDQVLALKWVRDHIKYFGGNPDSVTTLGYSAGSISITLLMISPMSIGTFRNVLSNFRQRIDAMSFFLFILQDFFIKRWPRVGRALANSICHAISTTWLNNKRKF